MIQTHVVPRFLSKIIFLEFQDFLTWWSEQKKSMWGEYFYLSSKNKNINFSRKWSTCLCHYANLYKFNPYSKMLQHVNQWARTSKFNERTYWERGEYKSCDTVPLRNKLFTLQSNRVNQPMKEKIILVNTVDIVWILGVQVTIVARQRLNIKVGGFKIKFY